MKKYRVLLIAEAANPEWVSVPLVGWSLSNAVRKIADVHIVTQIRNKDAILRAGLKEGKEVTFIDSEALARPLWKVANVLRGGKGVGWTITTAMSTLAYYYFEHLIWRHFGKQITNSDFDIVHRITPLSPVTPSLIAKKCYKANIPFVLGPLNGGVPWPKEFDEARRQEKEWLTYIRDAYKLLPGYRSTLKYAAALLVGSKDTLQQIPEKYHDKTIYLPENAIDKNKFTLKSIPVQDGQIRACFVGRLVPYKGPDMLIEAVTPLIKAGRLKLDIIGDGPLLSNIKTLVKTNGIEKGVLLHGWVEHHKVQDIMHLSQLFVFPSIREFGGGVVLEAMALGLIPIVIDYAGPGELVSTGTGIKIPMGSRETIINELRKAIEKAIDNPEKLHQMKKLSLSRVDEFFTWDKKAWQVLDVYNWLIEHRSYKPDFHIVEKRQ